jgi:hypothetical protein
VPSKDARVLTRVEIEGDKCLGFCVSRYLLERFPDGTAGFMTDTIRGLVRGSALHRFARFYNFGEYILWPREDYQPPHRGLANFAVHEDVFEAFIEAIVRDFGANDGQRYAQRFLEATIEHCVDVAQLVAVKDNYKDALLKHYHALRWPRPVYQEIKNCPSRAVCRALFLPRQALHGLPERVQNNIFRYDRAMRSQGYFCPMDCVFVGVGRGPKKGVAEQACSRRALLNFDRCLDIIT